MNKIRTSILATVLAGGSVVGLVGVTGTASAADPSDTATAPAALAQVDPATDPATETEPTPTPAPDSPDQDERAERREARRAQRQANRQEVADVLGITVEDLREQVEGGATLADIATANGVETSAVVDVIVGQKTARVDQAVADGRLTADEAAEKTADLDERVQTRVDEGRPERGDGEGRRGGRGHRGGGGGDGAAGPDAEG